MEQKRKPWRWAAVAGAMLILLIAFLLPGAAQNVQETGREAVREAVIRAAVECYAVEGVYPESLGYLEQNYGLTVNHQKYIITYEVYAGNQLPEVQVLVRGEE